jgi:Helix-turn-helix domain
VPSGPLRVNVENLIATLLPHGQARRDVVAQKLGLSPRTLGRKLSAAGISFARILEELRFGLAKRYLSERDLSISRIAWFLGYTEVSAFSHAFMVLRCLRRRRMTLPEPSSPTMLQLFLPRSMPRTAMSIESPFLSPNRPLPAQQEGRAIHKGGAEAGCWPLARRAQHKDTRTRRC